jgi:hypothetical protein
MSQDTNDYQILQPNNIGIIPQQQQQNIFGFNAQNFPFLNQILQPNHMGMNPPQQNYSGFNVTLNPKTGQMEWFKNVSGFLHLSSLKKILEKIYINIEGGKKK